MICSSIELYYTVAILSWNTYHKILHSLDILLPICNSSMPAAIARLPAFMCEKLTKSQLLETITVFVNWHSWAVNEQADYY